ncbi:hypothetical protein P3T37_000401 [Kitasatospora sp. MAA4]|uniref:hypothetical protein n=1 Tax=Kitasatospora sp. MAA4 TaxID=3035093 RepID=UPI0024753683|nr:hypothetical protein [Kitasatospora sp. MAA4]MDH6131034.1 hypothetical protein [Kitasatospora sp. MAA4]
MELRFIGKDEKSGDHGSPTIWVDEETSDLIIQGWKIDEATETAVLSDGAIPDHETVVRVPARMAKVLKEALDVAELD